MSSAINERQTERTSRQIFPVDERLIKGDRQTFREKFNREPFTLSHNLASHPLLQMPPLTELACGLAARPGEVYVDVGVERIEQRWNETPRPSMPVDEVIANISESKAWIVLRRAELDARYGALLSRCMSELKDLNGGSWHHRLRVEQNAIIFISSPRRISTYHIDRECNFILQLRGEKIVYIFDQNDREVLSEQELERFWSVDNNAATYKPQYQNRARAFHLRPGDGVHVPVNAPHWVQNGGDSSITLSVNFQFSDNYRANLYRANYYLRKFGITPTPPGRSRIRDVVKANAIQGARLVSKPLRSFRS
jgi:hypothetical protein